MSMHTTLSDAQRDALTELMQTGEDCRIIGERITFARHLLQLLDPSDETIYLPLFAYLIEQDKVQRTADKRRRELHALLPTDLC